jgi:light-regulated signal transduction histidine kinase (bacteriophytochrome)
LLGASRSELLGKRDDEFFNAELAAMYMRGDREVLATGAALDIPHEPVESREHGLRYVHTKKIPIADGAGVARYILGITEDITERKRASEAINDMNAALAKKAADLAASNEELEAFAYSVSHDLRAPLRHVNGFINLLREQVGDRLDAAGQRYLSKIQSASGRMSALIDELLALSRMSRIEMRYTRVSLDRLLKEVVQELRGHVTGRTIDWAVGDLPHVYGDRILLRQAFVNLLDNAIKYTAANPKARIEVGCGGDDGSEVTVYIRDNGVGFDMKYAHKLFGVFQRLHRQEEFPGTGIGLAHVRRIVERHSGRVWAQAAKGDGAVFYIALPKGEEK